MWMSLMLSLRPPRSIKFPMSSLSSALWESEKRTDVEFEESVDEFAWSTKFTFLRRRPLVDEFGGLSSFAECE